MRFGRSRRKLIWPRSMRALASHRRRRRQDADSREVCRLGAAGRPAVADQHGGGRPGRGRQDPPGQHRAARSRLARRSGRRPSRSPRQSCRGHAEENGTDAGSGTRSPGICGSGNDPREKRPSATQSRNRNWRIPNMSIGKRARSCARREFRRRSPASSWSRPKPRCYGRGREMPMPSRVPPTETVAGRLRSIRRSTGACCECYRRARPW